MSTPTYSNFFYSGQIRRFLQQFIRILSNFQVQMGDDEDGNRVLQRVPVFYGDASRQASQILRGNSENALNSLPSIAVYISAMKYDVDRIQEPNFVSKMNIRTRAVDPETGEYTNQQGDAYTVERLMPVPYTLTLKADIWTGNTEQKLMLIEQLGTIFSPALEIQSTDNYIDWTSLSYVKLTDISWTSRTVPAGAEESIDVASLSFELPIWLSPPAKVKKLGVIQKITASIFDSEGALLDDLFGNVKDSATSAQIFTFMNYGVVYQGNVLKLIKLNDVVNGDLEFIEIEKSHHPWLSLIDQYGHLENGISQIRLMQSNGSEIIGTVAYHPTDETLLLYTPFPDTFPANTLQPITAIINPQNVKVDSDLLDPSNGTRFLILHDIGNEDDSEGAPIWNRHNFPKLIAKANDIIEFNGDFWTVTFNSTNHQSTEYLTNLKTNIQYKWSDGSWSKSIEGKYDAAEWRLQL